MPNYFVYTYATAGILAILLALAGLSPSFIDYGLRDHSLFLGLLSYAYFLSLSLMFTLLIPRFRHSIIARLGKRLIFMQVVITLPFILWGSIIILMLLNQHA